MPAQQKDKQSSGRENHESEQLTTQIGNHVLHALGQPSALSRVQVRRLWENRYRVNVLVGTDVTTTKIAHSYFLVTDDDGNVKVTTPAITRQYRPADKGRPLAIARPTLAHDGTPAP
jgi:hypothetical protein